MSERTGTSASGTTHNSAARQFVEAAVSLFP